MGETALHHGERELLVVAAEAGVQSRRVLHHGRLDLVEAVCRVDAADHAEGVLASGLLGGQEVAHAARRGDGCGHADHSSSTCGRLRVAGRLSRMRILIAGATGVLGSRLTARLRTAGHAVVGTTRSRERFGLIEAAGGEPVVMDALDREAVHDVVAGVGPDVIVHELTDLAGFDFAASDRLRVEGTPNLVDAALAAGVGRMIAQSISWTYAPADDPARESEPFAVDAVTGEHPHAPVEVLEREVARMPVGTVLRYGLFYGPGTWYAADGAYTRRAATGEVVATTDRTSWVHVDDAVDATVLAPGLAVGAGQHRGRRAVPPRGLGTRAGTARRVRRSAVAHAPRAGTRRRQRPRPLARLGSRPSRLADGCSDSAERRAPSRPKLRLSRTGRGRRRGCAPLAAAPRPRRCRPRGRRAARRRRRARGTRSRS